MDDGKKRSRCPLVASQTLRAAARERLERERRKAANLVLPFALQRGRRNDQHALHFPQPPQERPGRDRLHGLAKTHLVGEQRALGAGKVQHSFALVRE